MNLDRQLTECKTLLCGISRKLDIAISLLQQLVNLSREADVGSYSITITEDQWRQWWRQAGAGQQHEAEGEP